MKTHPIHILLADDHPVFRFGLRALIETEPDMVVIAEADNGEQVIELARSLQPDLILMDINMPDINGIEATKKIRSLGVKTAVLMLTMFDDDTIFSAMRAGAQGYLLKGAQAEETLRAIRAAANGEVIFSPGVAERMMRFFAKGGSHPFPDLTPREREVLELIAKGLTNNAIAERLVLSPKTVRNQVSHVLSKLHVSSRSEAIIKAREAGLGDSAPGSPTV
jgi:DNA-binding NarL/FixJ family response regulator